MRIRRDVLTSAVVLLLGVVVVFLVFSWSPLFSSEPTVTRDFPDSIARGSTFSVSLEVVNPRKEELTIIDSLPEGLSVYGGTRRTVRFSTVKEKEEFSYRVVSNLFVESPVQFSGYVGVEGTRYPIVGETEVSFE